MSSIQISSLRLSGWYLVLTRRDDLLVQKKLKEVGDNSTLGEKNHSNRATHAEDPLGAFEWGSQDTLKNCKDAFKSVPVSWVEK